MPYCDDWMVQLPLSQLLELKKAFENQHCMQEENAQLRREVEGLRRVQNETLLKMSDLCRDLGVSRK